MNKWSFTKASTLEECPRKFQYEFVLKLVDFIKSDHMAIGEGIHKFLEEKAKNPELDIKTCEQIYLDAGLSAKSMVNPKRIQEKLFLVADYFKHNKFIKPLVVNNKPAVEHFFKLSCSGDIVIHGKIDIISSTTAVVDYKTGANYYKSKDINNPLSGKGLQLTIYSAATYQDFGFVPILQGFQVILKDGSDIQNIGIKPKLEWFDQVKQKFRHLQTVYDNYMTEYGLDKVWPANKLTANCFWCNYSERCARNAIGTRK